MATTQENVSGAKDPKQLKGQSNTESIDRKPGSERNNVDNGPNQVSNGTENTLREPGIGRVGNTSPEGEEDID